MTNKIIYKLIGWCRSNRSDIVLPNYFIGRYEMDVFKLSRNGIISEYEVKTSPADFLNDFKKCCSGKLKHDLIKSGERGCNRFYFVMPKDMIPVSEIPDYCGLIYFTGERFQLKKNAPLLSHKKYSDYADIAQTLGFREHNWRQKLIDLKKSYDAQVHVNHVLRKRLERISDIQSINQAIEEERMAKETGITKAVEK